MINHFSSRAEKEKALKTLFKCNLPPLPMPLSELKTFTLLAAVFGKVWEVEMLKNKYQMGDPVPDNVREWFEDDIEVFQNLRGATHTAKLGNLLKDRGTTITQLYRKMVTAAYTKRLGGEEHLQSYHLERDLNEINGLISQEGGNVGAGAIPEEEAGEKENEKDGEEERETELLSKRQEALQNDAVRKLLTPGEMMRIHKDAKCSETPVFQLISKKTAAGKLVSMSFSDGSHVSENLVPANDQMGEEMNQINQFDLIKIEDASVDKDKIVLQKIEQLEMTDESGQYWPIKAAVKANGVVSLKRIKQDTLDLWGIRFRNRTKVSVDTVEANNTLLEEDQFLLSAGPKQRTEDQNMGSESRTKRKMVSCPFCIRTFTDMENMKEHMKDAHFN